MLFLMEFMAPFSFKRFRRKIAPITIYRIDAAVTIPSKDAAAICLQGVFQMLKERIQVSRQATGMARVAGHRIRTTRMNTEAIGRRANTARYPKLICLEYIIKRLKMSNS
jgi:hypothetical protein